MKVLIHAGIHRTGTSSLQRFLHQNREILVGHKISYPGAEIHHQKIAWALKRNPSDHDVLNQLLENHRDSKLCILSGEDFCIHTDLSWLAELASKHDVHALFYLRRQDHWVMSWYNQHVKWPFDRAKSRMSKDEFLASIDDFYWLDFHAMLMRWRDVIGKEKLSVAVIEPGQVEDVTSDFVQRAGLPSAELISIEKRDNDSLPVYVLEVARQLGLFELPPKARIRVISALTRGLSDKACPERTILSPEERTKILLKFEHSNRNVAQEYFSQDMLFYEQPPTADEPYFRFPEMSKEEFVSEWIRPIIKVLART